LIRGPARRAAPQEAAPVNIEVSGRSVRTDEQGYLLDPEDWSEAFAEQTAAHDGITLYDDHWGLILYFRAYFEANGTVPTMNVLVRTLGRQHGAHFREKKLFEKHLYRLFPSDPVRALCRLAGLPKPPPDT
jgi:tRNA 2-thiouridine synthesizing protein E